MSPLGFVRNNALKLSYRGAKDKENKLLAFLGKKNIYIFFFLVRVVLSTKLLIFSLFLLRISFSPQVFPNSLLRTKRQTDFRLFSRHYIQKANALIMMAGFPGFYQMQNQEPIGHSMSYVNSLEKHHSNFVLLLKSQSRRRGSGSRRKSMFVRMERELNDKKKKC